MIQQFLVLLVELIFTFFVIVALLVTLAASVYDIHQLRQSKSLKATIFKLRRPNQPFITALIYARNNASSIAACLKSVQKSHYWNYDIVVIDDASTDDTRKVVRSYINKYPSSKLRLYSKRRRGNKIDALRQGYLRSNKGELVLVIDASNLISQTLLKESAARFVVNDSLGALRFDVYNPNPQSITSLYHRFHQLSMGVFIKAFSLISKYYIRTKNSGAMYRRSVFYRSHVPLLVKGEYSSRAKVIDNFSDINILKSYLNIKTLIYPKYRASSLVLIALAIGALFLQTYSIYIASGLQTGILLVLSCLVLLIWIFSLVLSTDSISINKKIQLSLCVGIIYFISYLRLVVYIFSFVFQSSED